MLDRDLELLEVGGDLLLLSPSNQKESTAIPWADRPVKNGLEERGGDPVLVDGLGRPIDILKD